MNSFGSSLQKEVENFRLSLENQESECRKLSESLAVKEREAINSHDELERKDNFIRIKVFGFNHLAVAVFTGVTFPI